MISNLSPIGMGPFLECSLMNNNPHSPNFVFYLVPVLKVSGGSEGKESACNVGDPCLIPGSGRFPGEEWLPTAVFLPGESHGQRSLVGYNPWGCKESDTTERLTLSLSNLI